MGLLFCVRAEEEELDSDIADENIAEKTKRKKLLEKAFGTNPQPCLEKVEYVVSAVNLSGYMPTHQLHDYIWMNDRGEQSP